MLNHRPLRLIGALLLVLALCAPPVFANDPAARAELIALWQKMTQRQDIAFRVTSSTTVKKGKPLVSTMEVRWPNQFHMKTDSSEMVILPSGTWMNAGGKWMKIPVDMQKIVAQYTPEMMRKSIDGTQNVVFVGLDSVRGTPVKVYTYDFNVEVMGINSSGTSKIFLSVVDGYPLRVESTGKAMGKVSTTVADYEYDDSIRISAPN